MPHRGGFGAAEVAEPRLHPETSGGLPSRDLMAYEGASAVRPTHRGRIKSNWVGAKRSRRRTNRASARTLPYPARERGEGQTQLLGLGYVSVQPDRRRG